MKKGFLLILMLEIILITPFQKVYSQEREISGTVSNANTFEPISKIKVSIKGTEISTVTGRNGKYKLFVPAFIETVEFSDFPGMNTHSIVKVSDNVFNILLEPVNLFEMSLRELMNLQITTLASGTEESLLDAPATMMVITEEEIRQRGYHSLDEVVMDLPGFDGIMAQGTDHIIGYQRGYRTPFFQRTLIMVNNRVDNHLWTQATGITRQRPLSNIKKIEVLYGPASAVYGPNAFLGIINIVTKDGYELNDGEAKSNVNINLGSYNTRGFDLATRGKSGDFSYGISAKVFRSDEADLSDKSHWLSNDLYGSETLWGPICDIEHRGEKLGHYYDPTDDYGILGTLRYKGLKFHIINWALREGYGPFYTADHAQNNALWNKSSKQYYFEYDKEFISDFKLKTTFGYRESRIYGVWGEASADWGASDYTDPDNPQFIVPNDTIINVGDTTIVENYKDYSLISLTNWNSISNSWFFNNSFEWNINDNILLGGGLKYERKELTKAYDIPGYWNVYSSSVPSTDPGPYGWGAGVGHSSDETYILPPFPSEEMPPDNLILTEDIGGFLHCIFDLDLFRFNLGIRYDKNSVYGSTVNPRISGVFKPTEKSAIKIAYGEAFQEPAPLSLWGGWSGRLGNPDLKPEKARNFEFMAMLQGENLYHDFSAYMSSYENVIKEEAENAGSRDILGAEYRLRYSFLNIIPASPDITGYFFFTYCKAMSSIYYDHNYVWYDEDGIEHIGKWLDGEEELGDIAPHKVHFGINIPVQKSLNVNLRGHWIGERVPYLRNALRAIDENIDPYLVFDSNISYNYKNFLVSFKIKNLLNAQYFHPGAEQAEGGPEPASLKDENGHYYRSGGFRNSMIPQPDRHFMLTISYNY